MILIASIISSAAIRGTYFSVLNKWLLVANDIHPSTVLHMDKAGGLRPLIRSTSTRLGGSRGNNKRFLLCRCREVRDVGPLRGLLRGLLRYVICSVIWTANVAAPFPLGNVSTAATCGRTTC